MRLCPKQDLPGDDLQGAKIKCSVALVAADCSVCISARDLSHGGLKTSAVIQIRTVKTDCALVDTALNRTTPISPHDPAVQRIIIIFSQNRKLNIPFVGTPCDSCFIGPCNTTDSAIYAGNGAFVNAGNHASCQVNADNTSGFAFRGISFVFSGRVICFSRVFLPIAFSFVFFGIFYLLSR